MSSTVKRQHYVWRHYLRAWSQKESIWVYFKELKKVERTGLMQVAQERYFYELVDFTEEEEAFLKNYIETNSPPVTKPLNFDFLTLFSSTGKLKKRLEETTNPAVDKEKLEVEIRKMEINLMEHGHGRMEALGQKLLTYRSLEDLKTIEKDDYIFDALMFLSFQYFRTKNIKKLVLKSFIGGPYETLAKNCWNVLSYVMATTLARNLSLDQNLRMVFIHNNTDQSFITGDQPVFNILGDQVDDKGDVTDLELYYPLTPKHALSIHFRNDQVEKFASKDADEKLLGYLSAKVYDNADFFVFADKQKQLELLCS